jgi:hypothetical protein
MLHKVKEYIEGDFFKSIPAAPDKTMNTNQDNKQKIHPKLLIIDTIMLE